MADKRNPFAAPIAGRLGQTTVAAVKPPFTGAVSAALVDAAEPYRESALGALPVVRFEMQTRRGFLCSFPYSHVGLIECPSPESILMHCTGGGVASIAITGRGLDQIARLLTAQRLLSIVESDQTTIPTTQVAIREIAIRPEAPSSGV